MNQRPLLLTASLAVVAAFSGSPANAATILGAATYTGYSGQATSANDTPGVPFSTSVIARTADGRNGSNNGASNTDNVLEDTLVLSSFRNSSGSFRADFSAASLGGQLPTYVGLVFAERTGERIRAIIAYDSDDNVLESNPHFPALRSGPTAGSGATSQK